jgi:hypothetical protein
VVKFGSGTGILPVGLRARLKNRHLAFHPHAHPQFVWAGFFEQEDENDNEDD